MGIDAAARVWLDLGYTRRDQLLFPAKKLRAYWCGRAEAACVAHEASVMLTDLAFALSPRRQVRAAGAAGGAGAASAARVHFGG